MWAVSEASTRPVQLFVEYMLPSMKFAPLQQFDSNIKEPHRYYFPVLPDESLQRFTDPELPHVETFESKRSQLKHVAMFLRACYIESSMGDELVFYQVMQRKQKQLLEGCKFSLQHFYVSSPLPMSYHSYS